MKMKCVVDSVAGFVAEVPHRLLVVLDTARHLGFDSLESLIGQIEWNADERRAVGTSPLVAEIDRRPEPDPALRQLVVELGRESFDARAFDGKANIRNASAEKRVALRGPGIGHGREEGKVYTRLSWLSGVTGAEV